MSAKDAILYRIFAITFSQIDASNTTIMQHKAPDAVPSVSRETRRTSTGIVISNSSAELGRYLSEYFRITCYNHNNIWPIELHLNKTCPQFVILQWTSRQQTLDVLATIIRLSNSHTIITGPESESYCIAALDSGAADYVAEPVSTRELLARIRAALRYNQPSGPSRRISRKCIYEFGQFRYDSGSRRLTGPQGLAIPLSRSECSLLFAFIQSPGQFLTREYLLNATRLIDNVNDRVIDARVCRLRNKLHAITPNSHIIITARGFGYKFDLPVTRSSPHSVY